MLRRQGKKAEPKNQVPVDVMSRQDTAIWLGRAMSTNEVSLRVVLELLDVVAVQQAAIMEFHKQSIAAHNNSQASTPMLSSQQADSERILEKLTQLRELVMPVLKVVEDACQQFEKIIK